MKTFKFSFNALKKWNKSAFPCFFQAILFNFLQFNLCMFRPILVSSHTAHCSCQETIERVKEGNHPLKRFMKDFFWTEFSSALNKKMSCKLHYSKVLIMSLMAQILTTIL